MPENGDDKYPVKTTLSKQQLDFVDNIINNGLAMNRADAVRYIVVRAMEQKEQKAEG